MIRLQTNVTLSTHRISDAVDRAAFRNFGHAASRISKDAKASIETSDEPSAPGQPPHTKAQRGHNLRGAIRYASNKQGAVIGPIASWVGEVGEAHEFGRAHEGDHYPARPFMLPALEQNLDRFHAAWAGSVK